VFMLVELERTRVAWFRACFVVLFFSVIVFLLIVYPAYSGVLQLVVGAVKLGLVLVVSSFVLALIIRAIPPLRGLWLQPLPIELCLTPEVLRSGEPFSYSISVDRATRIQSWAVTLIGVHEWQGDYELEGDRIAEITTKDTSRPERSGSEGGILRGSLFVPKDAPPSSKKDKEEVRWTVAIEIIAFLNHRNRRFVGKAPVTVRSSE
jgi:hypothetical protein